MNIEVEIKVKADGLDTVREKVSGMGSLVKTVTQVDDYYTPAHKNFFLEKPFPVEYLRVRKNPGRTVLEYTRKMNPRADGDYDYAEEYETMVESPDELEKILELLGFVRVVTVEKEREYWLCGDIEAALDTVTGLGTFVEAEAKGSFKDNAEARAACVRFLESLGFKDVENTQIKRAYPYMLFEKLAS